ncbi:MspA family porin [Nocardia sp. NPDC004722]
MRDYRNAAAVAAVAATIGLLSTGAANADTFVPLPDGHITEPGVSMGISAGISSSPSLSGSLSLPLGPGEVKWVNFDQKDMVESGEYHFDLQDQQVEIQGCAGYARARQVVTVEIVGPDYSKTTLYGQPFSIG